MEVPVPFTGEDVDTDDGIGAVFSVILLILGFGVFALAQNLGGTLASTASNFIAETTGWDPSTGEETGVASV